MTRLTDAERDHIVELLPSGMSCRAIGIRVGRSRDTVSKIAKAEGHVWGEPNQARTKAVEAYGSERRARLMARLQEEADLLLDALHDKFRAYNIGGKDNVYTEHIIPEPDTRAKRDLIMAAATAIKAALEIDKHDNRSTDVDQAAGLIVALVDGIRGDTPDAT